MNNFCIRPKSLIRVAKLWPYARKKGHQIGEYWRVGYYSESDGADLIWLVDDEGNYRWTIDEGFLKKHFEIVELSAEKSYYGKDREKLGRRDQSKPHKSSSSQT